LKPRPTFVRRGFALSTELGLRIALADEQNWKVAKGARLVMGLSARSRGAERNGCLVAPSGYVEQLNLLLASSHPPVESGRTRAHCELFKQPLAAYDPATTRSCLNEDCVLGSSKFQNEIEAMAGRKRVE
jgi:hypothetical protein